MTEIDFAYFNFEQGGLIDGRDNAYSSGRGYDFNGLVRVAGDGGRWPHILILGEGDRYQYAGGEGMWEAAAAMRAAGGRPYVPLLGSLPREWGPHAPVIFVDAQSVVIRRWHDHRNPDFAARHRNLLIATLPGRGFEDLFRVVAVHGDLYTGETRLADATALRRFADPAIPCLIGGDWNSVPSGPGEDRELNDPRFWPQGTHWARAPRIVWEHGAAQAGPYRPDTRALDYLTGWWHPETRTRIGGIGFYDVAELAGGDYTPTQVPTPDGRQRRALDKLLVNERWKDRIVPGSFHVHEPADPGNPDSDHKRVSVAVRA